MDMQEQMNFFHEIFSAELPRLGAGDDASTKKALALMFETKSSARDAFRSRKLRMLDIGCGNGAPTIQLAKDIAGTILAVDNHQPYLDELRRRAEAEGVAGKIQTRHKDMRALGAAEGLFDLVWCEGATFIMGFGAGLAAWRSLLEEDGLPAVSEMAGSGPTRRRVPQSCRRVSGHDRCGRQSGDDRAGGYRQIGHFPSPESAGGTSMTTAR